MQPVQFAKAQNTNILDTLHSTNCSRYILSMPRCQNYCICKLLDRIKANLMGKVSIFPLLYCWEAGQGLGSRQKTKKFWNYNWHLSFYVQTSFYFFSSCRILENCSFPLQTSLDFFSSFRTLEKGSAQFLIVIWQITGDTKFYRICKSHCLWVPHSLC